MTSTTYPSIRTHLSTSKSSMTNSDLTQAANVAFSVHKRLDSEFEQTGVTGSNPLNQTNTLDQTTFNVQKRKRKVTIDVIPQTPDYNMDFLSGIFQDIAEANETVPKESNNSSLSPLKKTCLGLAPRITQCGKSFLNLACNLDGIDSQPSDTIYSVHSVSTSGSYGQKTVSASLSPGHESAIDEFPISTRNSLLDQLQCVAVANESSDAAHIVDQVLDTTLIFPCLPATISENSCSITNLTHMMPSSMNDSPSAMISESEAETSKDTYGWFVTMDDESDNVHAIAPTTIADTVSDYRSSDTLKEGLSFIAASAPNQAPSHDAEVEWAKAADTVDDVLGDLF